MELIEQFKDSITGIEDLIDRGTITVSALARVNGISRKHVRNILQRKVKRSSLDLQKFIDSAGLLARQKRDPPSEIERNTPVPAQIPGTATLERYSTNDLPFVKKLVFLTSLLEMIPDYTVFLSYMFNPEDEKRVHRLVGELTGEQILFIREDTLFPGANIFREELSKNQRSYYLNAAVGYLLYIVKDYNRALTILLTEGKHVDREYCVIQIVKQYYEEYKLEDMYRTIVMYRHQVQNRGLRTSRALKVFFQAAFIRYYHEKRNYSSVILLAMPFLSRTGIHASSQSRRFSAHFDMNRLYTLDKRFGNNFHDVSTYCKKAVHAIITAYANVDQFSLARELTDFCLEHFPSTDRDYPALYLFYFLIYRNYGNMSDLSKMIQTIEETCGSPMREDLSFFIYRFYLACYEKDYKNLEKLLHVIHNLCREKPDLLSHTVFMSVYIQYMLIYGKYGRALMLILNWLFMIPKNYHYLPLLFADILEILTGADTGFSMVSLAELSGELINDPFSDTFNFIGGEELWEKVYLFLCDMRGFTLPHASEFGVLNVEDFFVLFMAKIDRTAELCQDITAPLKTSGIPRRTPEKKEALSDSGKDWFIYDLYLSDHFKRPYRLRSIPTSLIDLKPYLKEFNYIPVFHFLGMYSFLKKYRSIGDKKAFLSDFMDRLEAEKNRILKHETPRRVETPSTEKGIFHLIDMDLKESFLPYYLLKILEGSVP